MKNLNQNNYDIFFDWDVIILRNYNKMIFSLINSLINNPSLTWETIIK